MKTLYKLPAIDHRLFTKEDLVSRYSKDDRSFVNVVSYKAKEHGKFFCEYYEFEFDNESLYCNNKCDGMKKDIGEKHCTNHGYCYKEFGSVKLRIK